MKDKAGPIGDYPAGKLHRGDKDAVNTAISHDSEGRVHIDFGTDLAWLALEPPIAIEFAKLILHHAGVKKVEIEF